MPTSEVVRYSGYRRKPSSSKTLLNTTDSNSSSFGSGGEDWVTRKRVEVKTTKNIEKRVQRQVVLEDGRVIEEDDPEITVDTIEDTQSHSDSADEEATHVNALVQIHNGEWTPGYNVVGEKLQRNTYTNKVEQKSYSTASASNLGDLSKKDIHNIVNRGRSASSLVKTGRYGEDLKNPIAPRILHKDAKRNKLVDVENVHEISQMNARGHLRTDRIVDREVIDDKEEETPTDGESTETESHDGDRDAFTQHKEDRIIDYYKVPKGAKGLKDAKFIRRGIHLSSCDKNDQKGGAINYTRAIKYDSDSTTASGVPKPRRVSKPGPPTAKKPSMPGFTAGHIPPPNRYSTSSEREETPRRYHHTVERTNFGPAAKSGRAPDSSYRSRSMSRSPNFGEAKKILKKSSTPDHHKSMGSMRSDLDDERSSRLKRAMSFSSKGHEGQGQHQSKASFLDSVKSLYSSIRKVKTPTPNPDRAETPVRPPRKARSQSSMSMSSLNNAGTTSSTLGRRTSGYTHPRAVPRHYPRQDHEQHHQHHRPSPQPRSLPAEQQRPRKPSTSGGSSLFREESGGRQWEVSSSTLPRAKSRQRSASSSASALGGAGTTPRPRTSIMSSILRRDSSRSKSQASTMPRSPRSSMSMDRASSTIDSHPRMIHRSRDSGLEGNRDPPRFERTARDTNNRFFGQGRPGLDHDAEGGAGGNPDSEVITRTRPPPDMRRLLLNNLSEQEQEHE